MTQIETLAAEASGLYEALEDTGRRVTEVLRLVDESLLSELLATFESEEMAAGWLVGRTIGFGGRSALDLLAQGKREKVLQVLHHLRYGLCT